jgi:hypothetical protein
MKGTPKLSLPKLYGEFAIFVGSTFSFLLMLLSARANFPYSNYVSMGFFIISYVCYSLVLGKVLEYYLSKTVKSFKENYSKIKWWFWGAVSVVLIIVFCVLGYYNLSKEGFWQTIMGSGIGGAILLLAMAGKQLINKRWPKKK